jgi:hypothetical protein
MDVSPFQEMDSSDQISQSLVHEKRRKGRPAKPFSKSSIRSQERKCAALFAYAKKLASSSDEAVLLLQRTLDQHKSTQTDYQKIFDTVRTNLRWIFSHTQAPNSFCSVLGALLI